MNLGRLNMIIKADRRLLTEWEQCVVACATGDIKQAPYACHGSMESLWNRIGEDQRDIVLLYRWMNRKNEGSARDEL